MLYKVWDHVLLPRKATYNPKYDRDIWGVIKEIREWRYTSYLIWKTRYLEQMLREMGGTALHTKEFYSDKIKSWAK